MFKRILDLRLADELCEAGLLWYDFHPEYKDPTVGVIPEVEEYPRPFGAGAGDIYTPSEQCRTHNDSAFFILLED